MTDSVTRHKINPGTPACGQRTGAEINGVLRLNFSVKQLQEGQRTRGEDGERWLYHTLQ